MNYICIKIILLTFICVTLGYGQLTETRDGRQLPEPKAENILPVIVSQPSCPLRIDGISVVTNKRGQIDIAYLVRNVSNKNVTEYTIARWFSSNTGSLHPGLLPASKMIKPGETVGELGSLAYPIASADELKNSGPSPRISRIVFVMIGEVQFDNGEKYSDLKTFDSLEKHLELFELIYLNAGSSGKKAGKPGSSMKLSLKSRRTDLPHRLLVFLF